jgi:hypothetical protein
VSDLPDIPQGTTHSGKTRGTLQAVIANNEQFESSIMMSVNIMGEPTNIQEAGNLPGEEGEAWEQARQEEWKNMVDHNVFSAPAEPPPNTQVLKMGTVLRSTCHDGKITKRKVASSLKAIAKFPVSITMRPMLPSCSGKLSI